jgi:hypothetical protein
VLDRFDGRLRCREWQQGYDLSQIAPQLLAEIGGGQSHVARDERVAHGLGAPANIVVIHGQCGAG